VVVLSVSVAALAALLSGCGGGGGTTGSDSFTTEYPTHSAQIHGIGTQLANAIGNANGETNAQLLAALKPIQSEANNALADLQALDPPDDLQAGYNELITALEKGTGDLDDIVAAVEANDATAARTATIKLVTDSAGIRKARAGLDADVKAASG
jgi:hypothetical protein